MRFKHLAYVAFCWCTSSSYPEVEFGTTWWWAMRQCMDGAGKDFSDISALIIREASRLWAAPASCLMCCRRSNSSSVQGFLRCGLVVLFLRDDSWGNKIDIQIKLLDTKVQLNPEGALLCQPVGAYWLKCAQKENNNNNKHPLCRNRCFLPCIGSAASQTPPSFISFMCTACFRVVFVYRQVVFSSVWFFP